MNASATNLDDLGNTFAYDFAMGLSPNVIQFSVEATNNYFASMSAPVMANISYGQPGYYATLVDDTNFNHAFWNSYVSSNLTVNLGLVEGWHDVWVGLRGHADTADEAVWQSKQLKLDFTPPALVITGPMVASGAAATVDVPVIQLTGYSPEALGSISYDLSNAAGTVTNQQVLVLNRYYDTNIFEFTTNTFQAFDVVLTNGVNTFTIHATDLAGNVTTLVTNFTLDYSGKTNPPSVQITWPQNGIKIANSSVTIRGQVADATVAVTASVVSTNGTTNTVSGVVERSGRFWLDNLPLNGGTNLLTITASDVVGNAATTNLNLVKDDMTLTLDDIGDLTELWQPVMDLTGEVSDPTACVWVNGVRGTNYGDGTWAASNVPVTEGGVAIFDLNAVPAGEGDPANSVFPGKFEHGGGFVIEDLVAGKDVELRAEAYPTDCYPRKEVRSRICLKDLNQAVLTNPRNVYQNYNVAVNLSKRTIYTYMGTLEPNLRSGYYCSAGQLSPLFNDPLYRAIVEHLPRGARAGDYVTSLDVSARKPGRKRAA